MCESGVLDQLDHTPTKNERLPISFEACGWARVYFFTPRALFFRRKASDLHLRQRVAVIGFLLPQRRQILKNSLRFWAICFLTASVIGMGREPFSKKRESVKPN